MVVDVGGDAADFALHGTKGELVELSAFRNSKRVLLIFYPTDMTSG